MCAASRSAISILIPLASSLAIAGAPVAPAFAATGEVNLLVWEGYADKSFVEPFEAQSGCKVSATYVGSNDDFLPKLQAGGGSVYDLMSVSTDAAPIMIQAGLVDAVDLAQLDHWSEIYDLFRDGPALNVDGQTYGVPFMWGANPFIYRTDKITTLPTSIGDLWNPAFKGKVGMWDDKSSLYNTARLLGIADPFKMTDAELAAVKAKLIEQKPLVRKYWATAGELVNLMASGEVDISYTWGGIILNDLTKLGIPVAEYVAAEGTDGWTDNWMVVKGTPNSECVYKYINYTLSAEGQCAASAVTGYFPANPVGAATCMSADEQKAKHVGDAAYVGTLKMWQTPDRIEEYTNTWNAVKAAP